MKNLWLWLVLVVITFASCDPTENEDENSSVDGTPPLEFVTSSILGVVLDENRQALEGIPVKWNNEEFTTDENGIFRIEDQMMNKFGTFISVELEGYFQGSTRVLPTSNAINYATIQLTPKQIVGTFNNANGGEITLNGGAKIDFSPNAIVLTNDGSPYEGEVQVAAQWLSSNNQNISDQMPGNLQGIDADNRFVGLANYGIIATELTTTNGESVAIKDGATATLSFPIPNELQSDVPNTLPLWHFDETIGLWEEEGIATLSNGIYSGQVKHFSFWSIYNPFNFIYLEGALYNDAGLPIGNSKVRITRNTGRYAVDNTDNNGRFAGLVPNDEILQLEVLDDCDVVLSNQSIGPFSSDTDLGITTLSGSSINISTITGQVVDCTGAPIINSSVQLSFQSHSSIHMTDENGQFEIVRSICSPTGTINLTAIDFEALSSNTSSFSVQPSINVGSLSACGNALDEFFQINIGTKSYVFTSLDINLWGSRTSVMGTDLTSNVQLVFDGTSTGTFPTALWQLNLFDFSPGKWLFADTCDDPCYDIVITKYEDFPGKVEGSFLQTLSFTEVDSIAGTSMPFPDQEVEMIFSIKNR